MQKYLICKKYSEILSSINRLMLELILKSLNWRVVVVALQITVITYSGFTSHKGFNEYKLLDKTIYFRTYQISFE